MTVPQGTNCASHKQRPLEVELQSRKQTESSDESPHINDDISRKALPPESHPINDTWFYRALTLVAVKLLKRFCACRGNVIFLPFNLCIKYGSLRNISEAATMQYIAKCTSIPVPKVYCAFKHKSWTYIAMKKIDGEMLSYGWSGRTKESKAKIFSQLKRITTEMRSIPHLKDMGIANIDGGTLYDGRLPGASYYFGPFKSVSEFHRHLRRGIEAHPDHMPEVSELITRHERQWPICFTHGDLSSLNILANGDNIVALIDWETAGWYPSYWEYTTASNVNIRNEFWRNEIDNFLEPMPDELAMEKLRMKYFGNV